MLSLETLRMLNDLLGSVNLNAGEENFKEAAAIVVKAKKELVSTIAESEAQLVTVDLLPQLVDDDE